MVKINREQCIGCGSCVKDCLNKAIVMKEGKAEVFKECFECGHCVAICPADAVVMEGYDPEHIVPFDEESCRLSPDQWLRAVKCRRSIRQFQKKRVEKEKLEQILETGRYSPTASNAQNVSYRVFWEEADTLREMAAEEFRKLKSPEDFARVFPPPMSPDRVDFSEEDFLFKGGDTIVLVLSPNPVNAAIASANMEMMAVSLGLGVVYIGFFVRLIKENKRLREYIDLSDTDQVCTVMSIGYPGVSYQRSAPRKPAQVVWR